ncbi:MAG: hypothetical protein FJ403_01940 [Verrucomicrobia bacterium]|nr:hypothetical protein [Verrucomicrobiota bacterium]
MTFSKVNEISFLFMRPQLSFAFSKLLSRAAPLLAFVSVVDVSDAETLVKGRRSLVLEGQAAQLVVDIAGGSFVDFHLRTPNLNPLQWGEKGENTAPRPMGHFLCLDRWGAPSEAEQKNGMPFHGEAIRVEWQVLQEPVERDRKIFAEMTATLPLAGLTVKRTVELAVSNALFVVREEVTNLNKLGRIFNMVQHPTIGPPFLDEQTVVDANARRGFAQGNPLPNPEEPAAYWPEARKDGQAVNIRHLTNDHNPNVVSYIVDEDIGWATASNPTQGLLIGYLWKTAEYPWFNAWRHVENGKPFARGLEFGTTGLHQPFGILVAKGRIFERALYQYLDANESITKSYACFLFKIPKDYKGVARVSISGKRLVLAERDAGPERNLSMDVGEFRFGEIMPANRN